MNSIHFLQNSRLFVLANIKRGKRKKLCSSAINSSAHPCSLNILFIPCFHIIQIMTAHTVFVCYDKTKSCNTHATIKLKTKQGIALNELFSFQWFSFKQIEFFSMRTLLLVLPSGAFLLLLLLLRVRKMFNSVDYFSAHWNESF